MKSKLISKDGHILTRLTNEYLDPLKPKYVEQNYPVPKWIKFSEFMLNEGWEVFLHRSHSTVSKYIYIRQGDLEKKIRFSNHKPNRYKQFEEDSDYYVGISHDDCITTEQLIQILTDKEVEL